MSLEQVTLGMAQTNELFNNEVVGKRNFSALDQVYTSNARLLPSGAPMISGREAIKTFWSNWVAATNPKFAALTSTDVMPAGDGVVEIGRAVLTVEPPGQSTAQVEIEYVGYWRQEDGRWKWHVDI
jgi:ketosteroid isomerase-like protein